jgi:hypothetical protein
MLKFALWASGSSACLGLTGEQLDEQAFGVGDTAA